MSHSRLAVLAIVLIAASSPVALAQPPPTYTLEWTLKVEEPPRTMQPFTPVTVGVVIELACSMPSVKAEEGPIEIRLTTEGPDWLSATFDPNPVIVPLSREDCATGKQALATGNTTITVTELVPADTLDQIAFVGQIDGQPSREQHATVRVVEFVGFDPQWPHQPLNLHPGGGWQEAGYVLQYQSNKEFLLRVLATRRHDPLVLHERLHMVELPAGAHTVEGSYRFRPDPEAFTPGEEAVLDITFDAATNGDKDPVSAPLRLLLDQSQSIPAPHFLFLLAAFLYLARRSPSC